MVAPFIFFKKGVLKIIMKEKVKGKIKLAVKDRLTSFPQKNKSGNFFLNKF